MWGEVWKVGILCKSLNRINVKCINITDMVLVRMALCVQTVIVVKDAHLKHLYAGMIGIVSGRQVD